MASRGALTIVKFTLLMAFLVGAFLFARRLRASSDGELSYQKVEATIRSYEPYDRIVYVAVYALGTLALVPGTLLSFPGAVIYKTLQGTALVWTGAVIGATLSFLLARFLGRGFVDQFVGGKLEALDRQVEKHGFNGLLIVRLLPIFPFNLVNFGCGLTSIRLRDYVLATAIGILPGTFMYQYLFANVGTRLLEEGFKFEYLKDPNLLLPIAAFIGFILISKRLASFVTSRSDEPDKAGAT